MYGKENLEIQECDMLTVKVQDMIDGMSDGAYEELKRRHARPQNIVGIGSMAQDVFAQQAAMAQQGALAQSGAAIGTLGGLFGSLLGGGRQ